MREREIEFILLCCLLESSEKEWWDVGSPCFFSVISVQGMEEKEIEHSNFSL